MTVKVTMKSGVVVTAEHGEDESGQAQYDRLLQQMQNLDMSDRMPIALNSDITVVVSEVAVAELIDESPPRIH